MSNRTGRMGRIFRVICMCAWSKSDSWACVFSFLVSLKRRMWDVPLQRLQMDRSQTHTYHIQETQDPRTPRRNFVKRESLDCRKVVKCEGSDCWYDARNAWLDFAIARNIIMSTGLNATRQTISPLSHQIFGVWGIISWFLRAQMRAIYFCLCTHTIHSLNPQCAGRWFGLSLAPTWEGCVMGCPTSTWDFNCS